jgi:threonine dehydratase
MATEAFRVEAPTLEQVVAARENIRGIALRTPLVRLPARPGEREVWLKLETLAADRFVQDPRRRQRARTGVQGRARERRVDGERGEHGAGGRLVRPASGHPCTVVVPDHAPRAKRDAIERLGGRVIAVPFERWWQVFEERRFEGMEATSCTP